MKISSVALSAALLVSLWFSYQAPYASAAEATNLRTPVNFRPKLPHFRDVYVQVAFSFRCPEGTCLQLDLHTPYGPFSLVEFRGALRAAVPNLDRTIVRSRLHETTLAAQGTTAKGAQWQVATSTKRDVLQMTFADGTQVHASLPKSLSTRVLSYVVEAIY